MAKSLEDRLNKGVAHIEKRQERRKAEMRQCYRLARDLGFTPPEAAVLQNWKQEDIRQLARNKGRAGS